MQERPEPEEYFRYVTHVIYLDGPGSPRVDKGAMMGLGIECMRLYGPKDEIGRGGKYDSKALEQALEAVCGTKDPRSDRTRRNTLIG